MPQVKGRIEKASPYNACGPVENAAELKDCIALALRGDCMFAAKARWLQQAGAIGVIFIGENQNYCRSLPLKVGNNAITRYVSVCLSVCVCLEKYLTTH